MAKEEKEESVRAKVRKALISMETPKKKFGGSYHFVLGMITIFEIFSTLTREPFITRVIQLI